MVVVGFVAAPTVGELTGRRTDTVDRARLEKSLQVPVDGGEADVRATGSQLRVQLLSRAEFFCAAERVFDGSALPRRARRPVVRCHDHWCSRGCPTTASTISAACWSRNE